MKKKQCECNPRLNRIGGEAVLEGVMMKAGDECATAVRMPNGGVRVIPRKFNSVREKNALLRLPIIRGVVGFIETLKLSLSVMTASAEVMLEEEVAKEGGDKESAGKMMGAVTTLAMILGVVLAVGLFLFLPNLAAEGVEALFDYVYGFEIGVWKAVVSGIVKVIIFITYIYLVALMPDIKRTFQYHGAEHKTIACFEAGEELTPSNAKRHSRFHPRCGTSFMFVMIMIGVIISLSIRSIFELGFGIDFEVLTGKAIYETLIYTGFGLLLLPLIMGLGYEFLMFAGKHCSNPVVRLLSTPGLWMQRLTTREPSDEQLEIAIAATKFVLRDVYPNFKRARYTVKAGYIDPEVLGERLRVLRAALADSKEEISYLDAKLQEPNVKTDILRAVIGEREAKMAALQASIEETTALIEKHSMMVQNELARTTEPSLTNTTADADDALPTEDMTPTEADGTVSPALDDTAEAGNLSEDATGDDPSDRDPA